MQNSKCKILYEDGDLLVIDKPAGIVVFPENKTIKKTLIDYLLEEFPNLKNVGRPPRYGMVHRLDKDTSGILLVAKNNKALEFFQKQFRKGKAIKKYIALVAGNLKTDWGIIETLIGRSSKDRRKQKVYFPYEPEVKKRKLRKAVTKYNVLERLNGYTLIEVELESGRKHQIRTHLSYLGHPIASDELYGFKNQPSPGGLKRQFLHANYLKIKMPDGKIKEFKSELPSDLKICQQKLKPLLNLS